MKKVFAFFFCLLCVIAIPAQASSTNTTPKKKARLDIFRYYMHAMKNAQI